MRLTHAALADYGRWVEAQEFDWAARKAEVLPEAWRPRVLAEHRERRAENQRAGNTWLRELADEMRQGAALGLDATDAEIRAAARDAAASLYELAAGAVTMGSGIAYTLEGVRRLAEERTREWGVLPPSADVSDKGALARMFSGDWWVRRLRAAHGRLIERHAIRLGYVHKRAGCYVSQVNVERRREQRARNAKALAATAVVNQHGDEFTLAELAEKSNANPRIRRAELMTRIAGFEAVAVGLGHAAEFWTGTCPSRFHAVHWGGNRNAKHDGTTPRDAQAHLVAAWAKCRAAMQRRGIRPYGFRIAEPHHDGCPHWHLLLFMPDDQVQGARALFRHYFLEQHDAEEPGARQQRCKFVAIDRERGSAAGYVAKYVAKNIDGYSLGTDLFGNDEVTTAERVDAWAATWGIRQFQQIGGAPVGVWRELRRIPAEERLSPVGDAARAAADAGDWSAYLQVMGGPQVERKALPLKVAYTAEGEKFDPVEGVAEQAENCYGEPAAPSVFGVESSYGERWLSRRFRWEVRPASAKRERPGVSKRSAQRAAPWTRVNNCTQGVGDGLVGTSGEGRRSGRTGNQDSAGNSKGVGGFAVGSDAQGVRQPVGRTEAGTVRVEQREGGIGRHAGGIVGLAGGGRSWLKQ